MSVTTRTLSRRQVLTGAGVAVGAVGVMGGAAALGQAIYKAGQTSSSQVRVGKVVDFGDRTVTVRLAGGAVQDFPYVRSYRPVLGETVVLLANGPAWIVLDGVAGIPPDNPVTNGGFEDGVTGWGRTDSIGVTTLAASAEPGMDGRDCAELSSSSFPSVSSVVYSSAIPVQVGQQWTADAYIRVGAGGDNPSAIIYTMLTWYTNSTNVYPTTAAADSVIAGPLDMSVPQNIWSLFAAQQLESQWYPVPAAASYMRVAISCILSGSAQVPPVLIDRVIARQFDG